MLDSAPSPETFFKAFGLLSHLYLTPVLAALIEGRVPDHLDAGPLAASELAERTGLHALTVTRSLRALAAFGAFQEISPGVLAEVDYFLRDEPWAMQLFVQDLARGAFTYAPPTMGQLSRAMEVDRRFADLHLGLVDASVVALAESLGIRRLVTRDVRHFAAVRLRDGRAFDLVVHPSDPDKS